ncbi:MAG: DUF4860 domain-containing protein [Butyrivibrio sp.]|nr:DUF4860 domain-containing protein [Butyrivibrio sp.]
MDVKQRKNHIIDSVFVICLMLLFLLSSLSVIALGAGIYKRNTKTMETNYSHRVAFAYITEKLRQADENGAIHVESIFGEDALVMTEEVGDVLYNTYIYNYDNNLMELYAREDLENFYPQSGQAIMTVNDFIITEVSDNMFNAVIVLPDGTQYSLYLTRRSEKAG